MNNFYLIASHYPPENAVIVMQITVFHFIYPTWIGSSNLQHFFTSSLKLQLVDS